MLQQKAQNLEVQMMSQMQYKLGDMQSTDADYGSCTSVNLAVPDWLLSITASRILEDRVCHLRQYIPSSTIQEREKHDLARKVKRGLVQRLVLSAVHGTASTVSRHAYEVSSSYHERSTGNSSIKLRSIGSSGHKSWQKISIGRLEAKVKRNIK